MSVGDKKLLAERLERLFAHVLSAGTDPEWVVSDRTLAFSYLQEVIKNTEDQQLLQQLLNVLDAYEYPAAVSTIFTKASQSAEDVWKARLYELEQQGVVYHPLRPALGEWEELLRAHWPTFSADASDWLRQWHAAFWQEGWLLVVPPGLRIEEPLPQFQQLHNAPSILQRHMIFIGDQARASMVLGCVQPPQHSLTARAECFYMHIGNHAHWEWSAFRHDGGRIVDYGAFEAHLAEKARWRTQLCYLGYAGQMIAPLFFHDGEQTRFSSRVVIQGGADRASVMGWQHSLPSDEADIEEDWFCLVPAQARLDIEQEFFVVSADAHEPDINIHTLLLGEQAECHVASHYSTSDAETIPCEINVKVQQCNPEHFAWGMRHGLDEKSMRQLVMKPWLADFVDQIPMEFAVEIERALL